MYDGSACRNARAVADLHGVEPTAGEKLMHRGPADAVIPGDDQGTRSSLLTGQEPFQKGQFRIPAEKMCHEPMLRMRCTDPASCHSWNSHGPRIRCNDARADASSAQEKIGYDDGRRQRNLATRRRDP